ncbi:MAG: hypothetical protein IJ840_01550, partial [Bacteroidales bacterium]|nr:hypothetical protein [Bacteroidales bacterium]
MLSWLLPVSGQEIRNWSLCEDGNGIILDPTTATLPYSDHIEMSGEMMAFVLRWGVNEDHSFFSERSLVFPMLRTVPNNTHASLMHRIGTDVPSLVSVNGLSLMAENVQNVKLDGLMEVTSTFAVGKANTGTGKGTTPEPAVELVRKIFPSTDKQLMGEIYSLKNVSKKAQTVFIPEFSQVFTTPEEKGVTGSYIVRADILGSGTKILQPGESLEFGACFQAYREGEKMIVPDLEEELAKRVAYRDLVDGNLVLDTPDDVIDREFRFAKIRASESIFKTAGGYMHGPGGESYYAAIWANDQAEYVNPFFPFLGYSIGNESALNSYMHFARFMNPEFKPVPSSI